MEALQGLQQPAEQIDSWHRALDEITDTDLEAATDLLGVMERILERRVRRFGGDRRREVFTLNHAREHLEWLLARERERAEAIGR